MKKLTSTLLCLFCMTPVIVFADCQNAKQKTIFDTAPIESCKDNQECYFLCYGIKKCELYKKLGLSETQKCRADKIQDNYEFDTLSIREKLKCEEEALARLNQKCACESEIKAQKKKLKALRKDLKKTCKCYDREFQSFLSDSQAKQYKKLIK